MPARPMLVSSLVSGISWPACGPDSTFTDGLGDGGIGAAAGVSTKVDRTAALKALHDDLNKALADDEVERRKLSVALLPHARRFYSNYIDTSKHQPFYRPSSMA